jgi:hypothetical protein
MTPEQLNYTVSGFLLGTFIGYIYNYYWFLLHKPKEKKSIKKGVEKC